MKPDKRVTNTNILLDSDDTVLMPTHCTLTCSVIVLCEMMMKGREKVKAGAGS